MNVHKDKGSCLTVLFFEIETRIARLWRARIGEDLVEDGVLDPFGVVLIKQ